MQQSNRWLSIVVLSILLATVAGCNIDLYFPPDQALMEQAADTTRELAAQIGYTEENQLLEVDICTYGCAYMLYFTTPESVASFDEQLKLNTPGTWVQSAFESHELGSDLGDNPSIIKTYLPENSADQGKFLLVDGINVAQNLVELPPPLVVSWMLLHAEPTNATYIRFYSIRNAKEQYTLAGRKLTDNIIAVRVEHNRR
jgi:hypothetical protein